MSSKIWLALIDYITLHCRNQELSAENEAIKTENAQLRKQRPTETPTKIDIESLARLDVGSIISINGLTSRIRDLNISVDEVSKRVRSLSDSTDCYSNVLKEVASTTAQQFETIAANTYLKISPQAVDEFELRCCGVSAQLRRDMSLAADNASAKIHQSEKRVSIPASAAYLLLTILILSLVSLAVIVVFNHYVLTNQLLTSLLWRIGAISIIVLTCIIALIWASSRK